MLMQIKSYMKEITLQMQNTEEDMKSMKMVKSTQVNSKMIADKALENTFLKTQISMKVNGKMINLMGKVVKSHKLEYILEVGATMKSMEKE